MENSPCMDDENPIEIVFFRIKLLNYQRVLMLVGDTLDILTVLHYINYFVCDVLMLLVYYLLLLILRTTKLWYIYILKKTFFWWKIIF